LHFAEREYYPFYIMETCKFEVRDMRFRGAIVSEGAIVEIVAAIAAEKFVGEEIISDSQDALNNLCASARVAGPDDYKAFKDGIQKVKLEVKCSACPYHQD